MPHLVVHRPGDLHPEDPHQEDLLQRALHHEVRHHEVRHRVGLQVGDHLEHPRVAPQEEAHLVWTAYEVSEYSEVSEVSRGAPPGVDCA